MQQSHICIELTWLLLGCYDLMVLYKCVILLLLLRSLTKSETWFSSSCILRPCDCDCSSMNSSYSTRRCSTSDSSLSSSDICQPHISITNKTLMPVVATPRDIPMPMVTTPPSVNHQTQHTLLLTTERPMPVAATPLPLETSSSH